MFLKLTVKITIIFISCPLLFSCSGFGFGGGADYHAVATPLAAVINESPETLKPGIDQFGVGLNGHIQTAIFRNFSNDPEAHEILHPSDPFLKFEKGIFRNFEAGISVTSIESNRHQLNYPYFTIKGKYQFIGNDKSSSVPGDFSLAMILSQSAGAERGRASTTQSNLVFGYRIFRRLLVYGGGFTSYVDMKGNYRSTEGDSFAVNRHGYNFGQTFGIQLDLTADRRWTLSMDAFEVLKSDLYAGDDLEHSFSLTFIYSVNP